MDFFFSVLNEKDSEACQRLLKCPFNPLSLIKSKDFISWHHISVFSLLTCPIVLFLRGTFVLYSGSLYGHFHYQVSSFSDYDDWTQIWIYETETSFPVVGTILIDQFDTHHFLFLNHRLKLKILFCQFFNWFYFISEKIC
jgi:hypothetical protein